jgi:ribonuclease P protein component
VRFTFRRLERLHRKSDFRRVFQEGRRYSASGLTVWVYRPSMGHSTPAGPERVQHPRLGLAIPKSYGNAVARNRMKRLLREAFRLNKHRLPADVDMVFSARASERPPRLQTVEPLVLALWTKANLLQQS